MGRERLEPGAMPPKHLLEPAKGPDGIYRLTKVRHRRLNGTYTRTSAQGFTRGECQDEWTKAFERKIREGTITRRAHEDPLRLSDPMSRAFERHFKAEEKRVAKGKITQKTHDMYYMVTYKGDGPRVRDTTIRLEVEMGSLSIGEVGRPVFLNNYLEDVEAIVPGVAALQWVVLKGTFRMLTISGLYDVSPMAEIVSPEQADSDKRALFPDEWRQLHGQICARINRARWFHILFWIILGTGIRPGEAYALWWSDCPDLDDDTIDKAVLHVGATGVRPLNGGPAFRQDKRKHGRRGHGYYITLPRWLTTVLRDYKKVCKPETQDSLILRTLNGTMVSNDAANANLATATEDTALDWVSWGNLRDTVATHVAGRSGDPRRASAQLGHAQGASMAVGNYIDPRGYVHAVADNSVYLEELDPFNRGAK